MIALLRGGLLGIAGLFMLLADVWALAAVWIDGGGDFSAWLALAVGVIATVWIRRRSRRS